MNPIHILKIRDLSLQVGLGCTKEERSRPQEVRVNVELRFVETPACVRTDDLRDAICYAKISEALALHAVEREFHLVEKMAGDFLNIVNRIVEGRAVVQLSVHKVRPPVEGLLGGVEYTIGAGS